MAAAPAAAHAEHGQKTIVVKVANLAFDPELSESCMKFGGFFSLSYDLFSLRGVQVGRGTGCVTGFGASDCPETGPVTGCRQTTFSTLVFELFGRGSVTAPSTFEEIFLSPTRRCSAAMKSRSIALFGSVLLAAVGFSLYASVLAGQSAAVSVGSAEAAGARRTITIPLREQNRSSQSGTATLTERAAGTFTVRIRMSKPVKFPGPAQNVHVHKATCSRYARMRSFNAQLATVMDWLKP